MASNFKFKLLAQLAKKRQEGGFTLIELLVVVIIIGVLAAVALPNLLGQVGKARESEGKNAVGTINRAQQAYHFEKQSFASPGINNAGLAANNLLGVTVVSDYYTLTVDAGTGVFTTVRAATVDAGKNGIRAFAGATSFNSTGGTYGTVVCQTNDIGGTPSTLTGTACAATDTELK